LLAELAPGDTMGAVFRGLSHGEAWSCIPYPRVNRNLALPAGWSRLYALILGYGEKI
jgi:hypothetical protein